MNFKHGKFANLASKTHGSVSPEVPTSVISKDTSIEAPKNTNNTVFSSIIPLTCFYQFLHLQILQLSLQVH